MSLPISSETLDIAKRIIWFEPPHEALSDTRRFLAYAFRFATHDDMLTLRRHVDDDVLRDALEHAPAGIMDGRSWTYWRLMLGLPERPLPKRTFAPDVKAA